MKYYPLTAAQNMHHQWIMEYGTQQVSGVSIVASLKAPLDFKLLKKCILLEYERYGCMRLQFTKPDKNGNVKQYQVKETKDTVEYYDLRGEGTLEAADAVMQQWAYVTFDGDNVPMCEVRLVDLPEDFKGMFVHMDHRLVDSSALAVMVAVPPSTALTLPFESTVAIPVSLLDHVTEPVSVVLEGLIVAESSTDPPSPIVALVLFRLMLCTGLSIWIV